MPEYLKMPPSLIFNNYIDIQDLENQLQNSIEDIRNKVKELSQISYYSYQERFTSIDSLPEHQVIIYIGRVSTLASNYVKVKQNSKQINSSVISPTLQNTQPAWLVQQANTFLTEAVRYISAEELFLIQSIAAIAPLENIERALNITLDHDTSSITDILVDTICTNFIKAEGKLLRLTIGNLSAAQRFEKEVLSSHLIRDTLISIPFALQIVRKLSFGAILYEVISFYSDFQAKTKGLATSAIHTLHLHDHYHLCLEQFYIFCRDEQDKLFDKQIFEEIIFILKQRNIPIQAFDLVLVGQYRSIETNLARQIVEAISIVMEVKLY